LGRPTDLYINERRLSKEQYTQRHRKLINQIQAAEDQLHRQVPDIHNLEKALKRMDEIVETIKNGTPAQQREAIEALIQKVETRGGEITSVELRPWAKPFEHNTQVARREFESLFLP
jgi:hypothetical protein